MIAAGQHETEEDSMSPVGHHEIELVGYYEPFLKGWLEYP